jgi:hypothetical protein
MNDTLNQYEATLQSLEGKPVSVEYRLPSLRKIPEYLDLSQDDSKLLEFLCNKPEGFADGFTDDSIYEALDKVGEQMDPRIAAWIKRQAAKLRRLRGEREELGLLPKSGTGSLPTSSSKPDGGSPK